MSTAVAERPASVTLANGTVVTSAMSVEERSAAIRGSMGLPPAERPKADGFAYNGPPINYRDQQATTRQAPASAPREDGSAGQAPHAGMIAPTPEALERGNSGNLEAFDAEMRAKGIQKPLEGNIQLDERTGIRVDVAALERAHELYRSMTPAERDAERADYHSVLEQIYAGKLGLADMEDSPSGEQPRDAQGRYTAAPQYSPEQAETAHQSVADEAGFIRLESIGPWALSGYTLPRLVPDQTYHKGIFADLAWARANGISQRQVDVYIADGMRRQGLIR